MNEIAPWLLFSIILLILAFGIFLIFRKTRRFSEKELHAMKKIWQEITILEQESPEQAVIKADTLLNHILERLGYTGTLGEKLKKANPLFRHRNEVWFAHKLRNRVAHELNVKIPEHEISRAMKGFKLGFNDLDVRL